MRIFLLPVSTRRTLLYCSKSSTTIAGKPSIQDRIVTKANTTWTEWESATSGWKKTLTTYGNKAFSRIPFEEWGLKTLPALHADTQSRAAKTEVLFPPSFLPAGEVRPTLRRLALDRQALHRKRMWASIGGLPLALPFGLIPILPNVPFFYLAFRAWSHYKALYGARYLAFLLEKDLLVERGSRDLDGLYARGLLGGVEKGEIAAEEVKSIAAEVGAGKEEPMLLSEKSGRAVAENFRLPAMQVEIERAVEQVNRDLEKARTEKEASAGKSKES
ncbi:hypothetical protein K461DRAFT_279335 [Myriangium duriaei CBS 260.36]|uniref:Mitochondrial K+-H+ exchange-related-domain-containing protein n=1 Tax=Myriangium duriaei CBS 260.36 TaxID=1168546 RepID=A0A9P4IY91_9PEZI|nr:hypothetical protein K461DRAFT_279335 [Myriangium duriaei CBS 260.36]